MADSPTERKRTGKALRASRTRPARLGRLYAALSATNEAMLRAIGPQVLQERVCEIAIEHGGFQLAVIRVVDREGRRLVPTVVRGQSARELGERELSIEPGAPQGRLTAAVAARTGTCQVANDLRQPPELMQWRAAALGAGIASTASLPVRRAGQVFAVLSLFSREPGYFDDELVALLERMVANLSFALDSIDQDERRRAAEQALRESEARFRSLTRLSSDFYWETDEQHRFTELAYGTGHRPTVPYGTQIGKTRWEIPYLAPDEAGWRAHRAILDARLPFREFEFARPGIDAQARHFTISGEPLTDSDGRFRGYRGIGREITDRKLAEGALRESEARFRSLTDLSSDWYWEQDETLRFTRFSGDLNRHLGVPAERVVGLRRWELPMIEPLSSTWGEHRRDVEAHRPFRDFEYRLIGDDGKQRYCSVTGLPMFDDRGNFRGFRGIAREITARKEAERQLALHAQRQEWIARFGQRALESVGLDGLFLQAAEAAGGVGADGAAVYELIPASGEFLVRAAIGRGTRPATGSALRVCDDCPLRRAAEGAESLAPDDHGAEICASAACTWGASMASAACVRIRGEDGNLGVLSVLAAPAGAFGTDELKFVRTIANVLSTAVQRHGAEQRLAQLAQFDTVTGLPNRNLMRDRLGQAIERAKRHRRRAGVLFLDLDRFKLVNDTLGHEQGDRLLEKVGRRLRACVRASDSVARFSGDEFVVVLSEIAAGEDAALVAQKMLEAMGAPFELGGHEASVGASIGIALYPDDGDEVDALLKAADAAMYRAKESGRAAYRFFVPDMNRESHERVQLQSDLRRAIERGEFQLAYQPKVELGSGRVCGVEALLRWMHPIRGTLPASEFVTTLEEIGLIEAAGEWVVGAACAQIRAWRVAGLEPVPVTVNVSARQLRCHALDARIIGLVAAAGVEPALLEIDVAEGHLAAEAEHVIRVLARLREAGIRASIDDFGTGYSNFALLARFPVTALKVDRRFVRDLPADAAAAALVRAAIDLAHGLGFAVTAEGVETEDQAAFLRRHGCDWAQGHLFGKPMAPAEIAALLARAAIINAA